MAPEVKESFQRIYMKDMTGICAVEPAKVDVMPGKMKEIVEYDVTHRFAWLGVGEHVYVAGWLKTLHPAAKVNDKLPGNSTSLIKGQNANLRYGQLKEPLNVICKPSSDDLPFFITTKFQRLTAKRARFESALFGVVFACVGMALPIVVAFMYE